MPFGFDELSDDEYKAEFLLFKKDVYLLSEQLNIPEEMFSYNGANISGVEAYDCAYA